MFLHFHFSVILLFVSIDSRLSKSIATICIDTSLVLSKYGHYRGLTRSLIAQLFLQEWIARPEQSRPKTKEGEGHHSKNRKEIESSRGRERKKAKSTRRRQHRARHGRRVLPPRVAAAGVRRLPPPPRAGLRSSGRRGALAGGLRRQEHPRDLPGHHGEERHLPHRAGHRVRHQHGTSHAPANPRLSPFDVPPWIHALCSVRF